MRDVYVSRTNAIVPGCDDPAILTKWIRQTIRDTRAGPTAKRDRADAGYHARRARFDPQDVQYPPGQNSKIIRKEVAIALVCVGVLLEEVGVDLQLLRNAGLYVATGLSQDEVLEKQITTLCEAYVAKHAEHSEAERNATFFRMLPPLTALIGLSNSSASLISQAFGVRGPNGVFGVTSHSGHCALREGARQIATGKAELAIVGGANAVGLLSALSFSSFDSARMGAHEAEGAAFILLEPGSTLEASGRAPLCRLSAVETLPAGSRAGNGFHFPSSIHIDSNAKLIFGGSVFAADHEAGLCSLSSVSDKLFSWFEHMGSLGAASVPFDVACGAHMIAEGEVTKVVCLNRDVYGRDSVVILEAV